jgi:hypothetical protein
MVVVLSSTVRSKTCVAPAVKQKSRNTVTSLKHVTDEPPTF